MAPKDFLKEYIEEVEEHVQELEDSLLALESKGEDEEEIHRLFRAAHSIKGASAYMGMEQLARLTHELETVIGSVLNRSVAIRPGGITRMLDCVDFISRSIGQLQERSEELPVPPELLQQLADLVSGVDGEPGKGARAGAPPQEVVRKDHPRSSASSDGKARAGTEGPGRAAAGSDGAGSRTDEDSVQEEDEELFGIFMTSFQELYSELAEIFRSADEAGLTNEAVLRSKDITRRLVTSSQYMDYEHVAAMLKEWEAALDEIRKSGAGTSGGFRRLLHSYGERLKGILPDLALFDEPDQPVVPGVLVGQREDQAIREDDEELFGIFLDSFRQLLTELSQASAVRPGQVLSPDGLQRGVQVLDRMISSCQYMDYDPLADSVAEWKSAMEQATAQGKATARFLEELAAARVMRLKQFLPDLDSSGTPPASQDSSGGASVRKSRRSIFEEAAARNPAAKPFPPKETPGEVQISRTVPARTKSGAKGAPKAGDGSSGEVPVPAGSVPVANGEKKRITAVAEEVASSVTLRVDAQKVDQLLNQVGELVVTRSEFIQTSLFLRDLLREVASAGRLSKQELRRFRMMNFRLNESTISLGRVANNLQDSVMRIRMLPISHLFQRFPRIVRDQSLKLGKLVELVVDGGDTEVDRRVLERMYDPIVQFLRNAIAHGIEFPEQRVGAGKSETGTIRLAAYHQGDYVALEIEDDGRGIDVAKLRQILLERRQMNPRDLERLSDDELVHAIFLPGVSTRDSVDGAAGRGVGLDVVKENVERMNGAIDVESFHGRGARFTIRIPLTVAIIRALLVKTAGQVFTLPLASVSEIHRYRYKEAHTIEGFQVISLRGKTIPLVHLGRLLNLPCDIENDAGKFITIVSTSFQEVGLVVDGLIGEREVVIKPIDDGVHSFEGFSGATVLGDGTVSLILDVSVLLRAMKTAPDILSSSGAARKRE